MYIGLCICIYVYLYAYVCVFVYICVLVYICVYLCVYIYATSILVYQKGLDSSDCNFKMGLACKINM